MGVCLAGGAACLLCCPLAHSRTLPPPTARIDPYSPPPPPPPPPLFMTLSVVLCSVFGRGEPSWPPRRSSEKWSTRELGAPAPTPSCCPPLARGGDDGGRPADRLAAGCCQPPPLPLPWPPPRAGRGTPRAQSGTQSEGASVGRPAAGGSPPRGPPAAGRAGAPRGVQLRAPPARATAGPQIAS